MLVSSHNGRSKHGFLKDYRHSTKVLGEGLSGFIQLEASRLPNESKRMSASGTQEDKYYPLILECAQFKVACLVHECLNHETYPLIVRGMFRKRFGAFLVWYLNLGLTAIARKEKQVSA